MTGFTGTAAIADTVRPGGSEESVVGSLTPVTQIIGAVTVESGEEDVPLADKFPEVEEESIQEGGFL